MCRTSVFYDICGFNGSANEKAVAINQLDDSIHAVQESKEPTIDAIVEEKRKRYAQKVAENKKDAAARVALSGEERTDAVEEDSEEGMEGLEEEAGQQGAFNEETGEINWDCPCLGGMAHGPCGDEFKAAFSCFVYSDQEPKGMECIDKFQ
jgi:intermembrane space import and assembly protein 40